MTTSFIGGLAIFIAATMSLVGALRLPYVSRPPRTLILLTATAKAVLSLGLLAVHGARAMTGTRAPGEILGVLAGLTFLGAAVLAFRAAGRKLSAA